MKINGSHINLYNFIGTVDDLWQVIIDYIVNISLKKNTKEKKYSVVGVVFLDKSDASGNLPVQTSILFIYLAQYVQHIYFGL